MATDASFAAYVCEQAGLPRALTHRKMFGEYALYLEGKVVALVCDNQVFVKMTPAGRQIACDAEEGAPFPGAKPHLRLADEIDQPDLFRRLLVATAAELPAPKPKAAKKAAAHKAQRGKPT